MCACVYACVRCACACACVCVCACVHACVLVQQIRLTVQTAIFLGNVEHCGDS